jgi:hypothetical protein
MQSVEGKIGRDIAHTVSEFGIFPWEKLKPDCGVSRGGITGGMDFNPNKPHFTFVYEDLCAEVWAIPEELADLIDTYRRWGRRDMARGIRRLLEEGIG